LYAAQLLHARLPQLTERERVDLAMAEAWAPLVVGGRGPTHWPCPACGTWVVRTVPEEGVVKLECPVCPERWSLSAFGRLVAETRGADRAGANPAAGGGGGRRYAPSPTQRQSENFGSSALSSGTPTPTRLGGRRYDRDPETARANLGAYLRRHLGTRIDAETVLEQIANER